MRSKLRLLDVAGGEPSELAGLPSEVLPGSLSWSPGGTHVAFIARTDQLLALCLVGTADGAFQYLADLGRDGLAVSSFPPVAWSPDGRRLLYAAPAEDRPISGAGALGATAPPRLFTAELSQPLGRPLGDATGHAPAWRSDGSIVALARAKRDGPPLLRAVAPSGESRDLAELPLPAAATFAARWDVAHGQAIVALRGAAGLGASTPDYWRVRFRPEVNR